MDSEKLTKTIIILLSTYNGHQYVSEQVESILHQDILDDDRYEVKLLVRDDGSSDDTLEILSGYASEIDISIIKGSNVGPSRSFWELLNTAPDAEYYAFCDQDDVWFSDKLSRAAKHLEKCDNSIPQLYCSAVQWTDKNLKPIHVKKRKKHYTDFAHALVYSLSQGCTFVFNYAAIQAARKYDFDREYNEYHDWLMHKIVAMMGNVFFDEKPSMYYRQHGNNVIGAKNEGIAGIPGRVKRFLSSSEGVRSKTAGSLYYVYNDYLSNNPEKERYVRLLANYKNSHHERWQFMREKAFRREAGSGAVLCILILFNKI